ncbi:MAG: chemotaxis protein CheW [Phycisphaeraceae bacterium]|nr:chemotaxis protein CheW [Phycisphaeraceae bacterium]
MALTIAQRSLEPTEHPAPGPGIAASMVGNGHEPMSLLSVRIDDRNLAIPLDAVQAVIRIADERSSRPSTIGHQGSVRFRGRALRLLDTTRHEPEWQAGALAAQRILLIECRQELVGLVVDRINGVMRIPSSTIERASTGRRGPVGDPIPHTLPVGTEPIELVFPDQLPDLAPCQPLEASEQS